MNKLNNFIHNHKFGVGYTVGWLMTLIAALWGSRL